MTRFVDVPTLEPLWWSESDLSEFIAGIADTMRDDFRRWESFDKSARVANHSDVGVIELMPVSDPDRYAFKYVNGHPGNPDKGVSTVMAFGALADTDTGYPVLLSELTLTTAFRTAAASALATEALARPNSKVLGMIGCGAQSEFQAIAFHTILGIEEVRIFDIDTAAMQKLERHLQQFPALRVVPVRVITASCSRSRHRNDLHRRQNLGDNPDTRHGGTGNAHQRYWWRLPGQNRTAQ